MNDQHPVRLAHILRNPEESYTSSLETRAAYPLFQSALNRIPIIEELPCQLGIALQGFPYSDPAVCDATNKGLEDRWISQTESAVDRWAPEFKRAATDPGKIGRAHV